MVLLNMLFKCSPLLLRSLLHWGCSRSTQGMRKMRPAQEVFAALDSHDNCLQQNSSSKRGFWLFRYGDLTSGHLNLPDIAVLRPVKTSQ